MTPTDSTVTEQVSAVIGQEVATVLATLTLDEFAEYMRIAKFRKATLARRLKSTEGPATRKERAK